MPELSPPRSRVVQAAYDVADLAARHADAAEQARQLDPVVLRAIVSAGFARHFVAAEHGGDAASFAELSDAITTIGAECPATAWCASLLANVARMAGYLPEGGRKEIWQHGPDTVIVGAVSPSGQASREADGWRLSGRWRYVSAVDHSEWALVLGLVPGEGKPQVRAFALPRAAYRIDRTWSDIGMCATGSNSLIVEDVLVPDTRSFAGQDLIDGAAPAAATDRHRVPLAAVNGLSFCLPILGAAEGALRHWSAYAAEKSRAAQGPGPGQAFHQETLARCSGEIDAARLVLRRVADTADQGARITALDIARNQRDSAFAADLLVGSVDRLFRASGTSGHSTTSVLQRLWRDVHSAAGHVVLQFGPSAAAYAKQALELDGVVQ